MSRLLIVGILIISTMVRGERRALAASGCWPCADTGAVDCFVTLCSGGIPGTAPGVYLPRSTSQTLGRLQAALFFYFEDEPGRLSTAKLLSKDEARRIAAKW